MVMEYVGYVLVALVVGYIGWKMFGKHFKKD